MGKVPHVKWLKNWWFLPSIAKCRSFLKMRYFNHLPPAPLVHRPLMPSQQCGYKLLFFSNMISVSELCCLYNMSVRLELPPICNTVVPFYLFRDFLVQSAGNTKDLARNIQPIYSLYFAFINLLLDLTKSKLQRI